MALSDICFQEQEGQAYLLEIPQDTLHAPLDILTETNSAQYPVLETNSGSGDIFIMSE